MGPSETSKRAGSDRFRCLGAQLIKSVALKLDYAGPVLVSHLRRAIPQTKPKRTKKLSGSERARQHESTQPTCADESLSRAASFAVQK